MNLIVSLLLTFIIFVLIVVCSSILAKADADFNPKDDNEKEAKKYLDAAVSIGMVFSVLFLVGSICFYVFGGAEAEATSAIIGEAGGMSKFGVILFSIMAFVFVIIGFLSLMAAVYISKGKNYENNQDVYTSCMWVFAIAITGVIIVIGYYLVKHYTKKKAEKKRQEEQANAMGLLLYEQTL